ncbi:MAG: hypothetical protein OZ928_05100 [Polyangiaceae bacterium]|nr:hypothetical protein [Polyangiaceae bacterium]
MVKDFVAELRSQRVPRSSELVAALDRDMLREIDEAARLEWVPAAPVARSADTLRALVGPAAWRALHVQVAAELAERPLFRALIHGARLVFGATPATFSRIFPRALSQAHRNYGRITGEVSGARSFTIRIEDTPSQGLSLGLLDVFAGTFEGLLAPLASGVRCDVEYTPGARRALLVVRW